MTMFWQTLLIGFLVFAGALLALSLGWLVGGKRLRGSCGGLGTGGDGACALCESPEEECPRKRMIKAAGGAIRDE